MIYQQRFTGHGIVASMWRRGNCWDNACAETFFGTLRRELIHHRSDRRRDEAKPDVFKYIEVFYNRLLRHSTLSYYSPVEWRRGRLWLNQVSTESAEIKASMVCSTVKECSCSSVAGDRSRPKLIYEGCLNDTGPTP
jgi:hypothetical protein